MTIIETQSSIPVRVERSTAVATSHVPGGQYRVPYSVTAGTRPVYDVETTDVSRRLRYQLRYYTAAMRSLLCRHRLDVPSDPAVYRTNLQVGPRLQQLWHEFFQIPPDQRAYLTYFTTAGTCLFMRMLADLGINFRHLLHFSSQMCFVMDGPPPVGTGIHQQITAVISEISVVDENRVALVVEHQLETLSGRIVQRGRDTFIIGGLTPDVTDAVRVVGTPAMLDLHDLTRRPSRLSTRHDVDRTQVEVGHDAGRNYGRVSGDLNLVHTTRMAARLFGFRGAFLQGLGTANHVLADIALNVPAPLVDFEIVFARPLYLGQAVEILRDRASFEVLDQRKRVVAYGAYRTAMMS